MEYKETKWKVFFSLIRKTRISINLFIIAMILTAISATASTLVPHFLRKIIDSYNSTNTIHSSDLTALIGIFLSSAILGAIGSYMLSVEGLKVVANLRILLWRKIVKLPIGFYDKNRSADIASRFVNDTSVIIMHRNAI
ncbi:ABC transporter transmembrane domain-containing protein [Bacillus pumilus]|uniref:ABC transporter transmembrane domain-containing protein n=1 Tax=Bacillus pumilus TaxID=1408 RepID=UPI0031F4A51D